MPTVCHSPLVRGLKIWLQSLRLREALRDQLCFSCWSIERSTFFSCWSIERSTLFFLLEHWEINFFFLLEHWEINFFFLLEHWEINFFFLLVTWMIGPNFVLTGPFAPPTPKFSGGCMQISNVGNWLHVQNSVLLQPQPTVLFNRGRSLHWKEVRWMELGEGGGRRKVPKKQEKSSTVHYLSLLYVHHIHFSHLAGITPWRGLWPVDRSAVQIFVVVNFSLCWHLLCSKQHEHATFGLEVTAQSATKRYLFHVLQLLPPFVGGLHQGVGLHVQTLHQVIHGRVPPLVVLLLCTGKMKVWNR